MTRGAKNTAVTAAMSLSAQADFSERGLMLEEMSS